MIDVFRDCLAAADLVLIVAVLWFYGRVAGWLLQGSFELVSRRADGLITVLERSYTQWQAWRLCQTAKPARFLVDKREKEYRYYNNGRSEKRN